MAFLSHKVSLTNCGWWDTRPAYSAFARLSPLVILSIDCEVAPPENWGAYTLQKLINTIAIVGHITAMFEGVTLLFKQLNGIIAPTGVTALVTLDHLTRENVEALNG